MKIFLMLLVTMISAACSSPSKNSVARSVSSTCNEFPSRSDAWAICANGGTYESAMKLYRNELCSKPNANCTSRTCDEFPADTEAWHMCANIGSIQRQAELCNQANYDQNSSCDIYLKSLTQCGDSDSCKLNAFIIFKSTAKK